jgi:hypothetical protein
MFRAGRSSPSGRWEGAITVVPYEGLPSYVVKFLRSFVSTFFRSASICHPRRGSKDNEFLYCSVFSCCY